MLLYALQFFFTMVVIFLLFLGGIARCRLPSVARFLGWCCGKSRGSEAEFTSRIRVFIPFDEHSVGFEYVSVCNACPVRVVQDQEKKSGREEKMEKVAFV